MPVLTPVSLSADDLALISESLDSAIKDMSSALGKQLDQLGQSFSDSLDAVGKQVSTLADSSSDAAEVVPSDLPPLSLDSVLNGSVLSDLLGSLPELVAVGMGLGFLVALVGIFLGFMHRAFSVDDIE